MLGLFTWSDHCAVTFVFLPFPSSTWYVLLSVCSMTTPSFHSLVLSIGCMRSLAYFEWGGGHGDVDSFV